VLAINARRNCVRCSASDMVATGLAVTAIFGSSLVLAALRRLERHSPGCWVPIFYRGETREQEISVVQP
jgi:hypothetical protein